MIYEPEYTMTPDADQPRKSMGFTSVPHKLWDTLQQVSRDRDMGDTGIFRAALRYLLDQRDRGVKYPYLSPPKRQGAEDKIAVRKILWMPPDLHDEIKDRVRADHTSQTDFFITAIKLYCDENDIDIKVDMID
jgi:hypothetical protein